MNTKGRIEAPADAQAYAACMVEIKTRLDVVKKVWMGRTATGKEPGLIDLELAYLQVRKVIELIMMASLCSNRKKYGKLTKSLRSLYHADKIRKVVRKLNAQWYPVPITQDIDPETRKLLRVETRLDGFLTEDEMFEIYGRIGKYLHAFNPYNKPKKELLLEAWDDLRTIHGKIVKLLDNHRVQSVDVDKEWWVIMQAAEDGKVKVAEMIKEGDTVSTSMLPMPQDGGQATT